MIEIDYHKYEILCNECNSFAKYHIQFYSKFDHYLNIDCCENCFNDALFFILHGFKNVLITSEYEMNYKEDFIIQTVYKKGKKYYFNYKELHGTGIQTPFGIVEGDVIIIFSKFNEVYYFSTWVENKICDPLLRVPSERKECIYFPGYFLYFYDEFFKKSDILKQYYSFVNEGVGIVNHEAHKAMKIIDIL